MNTGIHAVRPVIAPDTVLSPRSASRRARLFALDGTLAHRCRLICSWHRDPDDRLVRIWEPDIVPAVPANSIR